MWEKFFKHGQEKVRRHFPNQFTAKLMILYSHVRVFVCASFFLYLNKTRTNESCARPSRAINTQKTAAAAGDSFVGVGNSDKFEFFFLSMLNYFICVHSAIYLVVVATLCVFVVSEP